MKITVLAVGKLRDPWVSAGCAEYLQRLRVKLPVEVIELKKDADLPLHVARLSPRFLRWMLDEKGAQPTSRELATRIGQAQNTGAPGLTLCIGGADGLPPDLVRGADYVLSLSKLTLPHRLARLFLLEQLYRAASILSGDPYHRD